jgi:hypothetical protein
MLQGGTTYLKLQNLNKFPSAVLLELKTGPRVGLNGSPVYRYIFNLMKSIVKVKIE